MLRQLVWTESAFLTFLQIFRVSAINGLSCYLLPQKWVAAKKYWLLDWPNMHWGKENRSLDLSSRWTQTNREAFHVWARKFATGNKAKLVTCICHGNFETTSVWSTNCCLCNSNLAHSKLKKCFTSTRTTVVKKSAFWPVPMCQHFECRFSSNTLVGKSTECIWVNKVKLLVKMFLGLDEELNSSAELCTCARVPFPATCYWIAPLFNSTF